jgi:hypothetical protein
MKFKTLLTIFSEAKNKKGLWEINMIVWPNRNQITVGKIAPLLEQFSLTLDEIKEDKNIRVSGWSDDVRNFCIENMFNGDEKAFKKSIKGVGDTGAFVKVKKSVHEKLWKYQVFPEFKDFNGWIIFNAEGLNFYYEDRLKHYTPYFDKIFPKMPVDEEYLFEDQSVPDLKNKSLLIPLIYETYAQSDFIQNYEDKHPELSNDESWEFMEKTKEYPDKKVEQIVQNYLKNNQLFGLEVKSGRYTDKKEKIN